MNNKNEILEEFNISELEDRVEFGLCGGSGGGDGGNTPPKGNCDHTGIYCEQD